MSLCCLQSCRSCVGSLVWLLPLCKDIADATCWSGASVKLCQTVIAFLWLTFNCCGSNCLTLSPLPSCVCVCVCGCGCVKCCHMQRSQSFYSFLNAVVLWLDASPLSIPWSYVKFNADNLNVNECGCLTHIYIDKTFENLILMEWVNLQDKLKRNTLVDMLFWMCLAWRYWNWLCS